VSGEPVVRVGAIQAASGEDVDANLDAAEALVEEAVARGARYVLTPEYLNYYGRAGGFEAVAESIPGPTTRRLGEVARRRAVSVHVGSLLERGPAPGRFYNTSVLLGRDGEVAAQYRKIHLFDIDAPGEVAYRESERIAPGGEVVVAPAEGMRVGMSICFDLRFPELYLALAARGSDVVAVPAAFTEATGRVHWELLVRARALDTLAFVVAAAQSSHHEGAVATWGHSMVVGPWGEILAAADHDGPGVVVADLDLAQVTRRRAQLDLVHLRRRITPA
jgi:predicted amidohydrolase